MLKDMKKTMKKSFGSHAFHDPCPQPISTINQATHWQQLHWHHSVAPSFRGRTSEMNHKHCAIVKGETQKRNW